MSSFLRPVIAYEAVAVDSAMSPVASGRPRGSRASPSRPCSSRRRPGPRIEHLAVLVDAHLHARQRPADRAEPHRAGRVDRPRRAGLGHAPALEDGHVAGVEELEHVLGDGRPARARHLDAAAEEVADLGEHEAVGEPVAPGEVAAHGLAGALRPAHAPAGGDRPFEAQPLGARLLGHAAVGGRVDLLEDARHRRQVRRSRLAEVGQQLLGAALPEGQRAADVQDEDLDDPRERVRERQEHEEDDRDVLAQQVEALLVVAHRGEEVLVREDAALWRAGRARGVDERGHVVGGDGRHALVDRRLGNLLAARPQLVQRHRAVGPALEQDHLAQLGTRVADALDLRELCGVVAEHRARAGVSEDVLALLGEFVW